MSKRLSLAIMAFVVTSAVTPAAAAEPEPLFRDVTATHVPQAPDLHALGSTMVDVDRDGDLDVVIAAEYGVNRLYVNDGQGRFTHREGVFGATAHDSEHVTSEDFDSDGFADLLFIAEDDQQHGFYLGTAGNGFVDVTDRLPRMSEGNAIAVGDVNGDGLPDVLIGNTAEDGEGDPQNFLWLSDPARPGHFLDKTAENLPKIEDQTQGIALSDIDGDGDLDMVVANQEPPNRLLLNDGTGRFTEHTERLDQKVPLETREVYARDFTGDGKPDILLLNLTSNNSDWDKDPQTRLLVNDGSGRFNDETDGRIPYNTFSVYSGAPIDLNEDGALDFIVGPIQIPGFVPLRVRAYVNDGKGHFSDQTSKYIPAETVGLSWGISTGDVNGDGKEDIFIGGWGTQARLLLRR